MQENINTVKSPKDYDWSAFKGKERGFLTHWCATYGFKMSTVYHLIYDLYQGGSGPKIRMIIEQALTDGLIEEYKQAA